MIELEYLIYYLLNVKFFDVNLRISVKKSVLKHVL